MSDLIKHMVDRFLAWKLPENFNPDGGVTFVKVTNEDTTYEHKNQPIGTNLLDAVQATAMVRHMVQGIEMEVSSDGERLIKCWLGAQERLARAKSEVNGAECDLANSTTALAKWMLPEDAKPSEKIAVWYGDTLIQVQSAPNHPTPGGDPIVTVRKRGRSLSR